MKFTKKILIVNAHRTIKITVPMFGRIKSEYIKRDKMRGDHLDLVIYDEVTK